MTMTVKKVSIDELMQLLMDMRQTVEYVDMEIHAGNILRIKKHLPTLAKEDNKNAEPNLDDINDLIV